MTHAVQLTIDGQEHRLGNQTREVAALLEEYPAAEHNSRLFYFLTLKQHCPWVAQLPEERQSELRRWCGMIENFRRRGQQFKEQKT